MISTPQFAIALAALMGAAGVVLAAMAGHQGDAARLGPASSMLLFHAPAVVAAILLARAGLIGPRVGVVIAFGFILAAVLFSGDLVMRHLAGRALFPMAAPTGGTLLILSWLALGVAAVWPR